MSAYVLPELRRWRATMIQGKAIAPHHTNRYTLQDVVLSDDMNADRPRLMRMAVGDTVQDHEGDTFERFI